MFANVKSRTRSTDCACRACRGTPDLDDLCPVGGFLLRHFVIISEHGERDVRVSIQDGWAVAHTFEAAGWALELIEHKKGHMIPMEHHDALKEWLTALGQVSI